VAISVTASVTRPLKGHLIAIAIAVAKFVRIIALVTGMAIVSVLILVIPVVIATVVMAIVRDVWAINIIVITAVIGWPSHMELASVINKD
jgi:hypothetical protein